MTFAEAYAIALQNGKFRKHDEKTKNAQLGKYEAPCLIFSVGSEAFSYGFDGVDLHKVKHTDRRSTFLINNGYTLIIR